MSAAAASSSPRVFTIPAHRAFLDTLAGGIFAEIGDDPLTLAAITILLPTRRACRSLREAFLRLSEGRPLLLPRMLPLNDLDDEEVMLAGFAAPEIAAIPPAIAPLKRQLMLARLIGSTEPGVTPDQAVRLATELARLLDQAQTERIGFDRLATLVPEQYAEHWQQTLRFLGLVTEHWPQILAAESRLDPAEYRNRLFAAQAAIWNGGGAGRIIAAGSTGSIPATADLLATIARLPHGSVVLPGLDRTLDDESWAALDQTHPQAGLKQLLDRFGIGRDAVRLWPGCDDDVPARVRLVAEAMRPAATTHHWRALDIPAEAAAGLTKLDCPGPREEAEAIALIMRDVLNQQRRTCALVTPDRRLAQRVASELARWGVDIDDSGGTALGQTPPGSFLRLTAEMVAHEFAPVAALAVCKHPLSAAEMSPAAFRALSRQAELNLLRGPTPPEGLAGLRRLAEAATHHRNAIAAWLDRLQACCADFAAAMAAPHATLSSLLLTHVAAAEALASTHDASGASRLWAGDAGEAAAAFIAELAESGDVLDPIGPGTYPALLDALMADRVVRPRFGRHSRLSILGPLEARLQRFDLIVLGGLNEGTWPAEPAADPWMSRPMRSRFGLPPPEQRIALAAHDVAQALCAPQVVVTRAVKVDGTPTVPSRWLRRLERTIEAAGLKNVFVRDAMTPWLSWARALTWPDRFLRIPPPAPKPPVAARPRKLSVTQIEKWMRDPYSIYARHILKLDPIDPLEQDASAAEYGTVVHHALQRFIEQYPLGPLPLDAHAQLCAIGRERFAEEAIRPAVMAFWWPRFERIATWFIKQESARRAELIASHVEVTGALTLQGPAGRFELIARADRIDQLNGGLSIIDYKTGKPPSKKHIFAGFAPQLPLEAAIAVAGGFDRVPAMRVASLGFWQLHGRDEGGDASVLDGDIREIARIAREGLEQLIAAFDDPGTGYEAQPNPEYAPTYSDYLHLARVKEWAAAEDEE